jgi:hypothetical protein
MKATVVGLVTPHVLRVVDLANQAETGTNVDWYVRGAVSRSLSDFDQHYNGPELAKAYVEGLERASTEAPKGREHYVRVLRAALAAARTPPRG